MQHPDRFSARHMGPSEKELSQMLSVIGVDSLDQLINETIPEKIRMKEDLDLPKALSEYDYLKMLKQVAAQNKVYAK